MRGTTSFRERRTLSGGRRLIGILALIIMMLGSSEAWGEAQLNRITSVQLEEEGEHTRLTIVGSEPPEYTIASRTLPSRIIVELSNARAEGLAPRVGSRTDQIAEVTLGARYVEGEIATRVFVYLRGTVAYQVEVANNALVLSFVSVAAEDVPRASPAAGEAATAESSEAARSSRATSPRSAPQREATNETNAHTARSATTERPPPTEHVVQAGEVIARIASRYDISVQELLGWNPGVNPRRLRTGHRLVVRGAETTRHRIRVGEVLSAIAGRYGVTIRDLLRWNPGLDPDCIRVGSTLVVQDPSGH